jgi:hypothetical protein
MLLLFEFCLPAVTVHHPDPQSSAGIALQHTTIAELHIDTVFFDHKTLYLPGKYYIKFPCVL